MPRGSNQTNFASASTSAAAASFSGVEMLGGGGQIVASGKASLVKKYFVLNEADLDNPPNIAGFRATLGTWTKLGVGWEQTVTYEALTAGVIVGDSGLPTSTDRGVFEVLTSYEVQPIIKHPRITKLKNKYNGTEPVPGYIVFPEFLFTESALGGPGGQQRNPMYGVTSYKEYRFTFRHTYYRGSPPSFDRVGKVITTLPAGFPRVPGEKDADGKIIQREYLIQMPNLRKEGNSWRIEQDYLLLDSKGIADDLFLRS